MTSTTGTQDRDTKLFCNVSFDTHENTKLETLKSLRSCFSLSGGTRSNPLCCKIFNCVDVHQKGADTCIYVKKGRLRFEKREIGQPGDASETLTRILKLARKQRQDSSVAR